jgi:hypothetical protein
VSRRRVFTIAFVVDDVVVGSGSLSLSLYLSPATFNQSAWPGVAQGAHLDLRLDDDDANDADADDDDMHVDDVDGEQRRRRRRDECRLARLRASVRWLAANCVDSCTTFFFGCFAFVVSSDLRFSVV